MMQQYFKDWTTRDYVRNIPPIIAVLLVLMVGIIFFGDTGLLAVMVLFGIVIGATPYFLYTYFRLRRIKEIEDQMPAFLRDLVETVKSGMNLTTAIEQASKTDYGKLSPEIKKMHHQMTWGIPFDEALVSFAKRLDESDLIKRSVRIIIEARKSGGDIVSIMETIAADASVIKDAEKERSAKTSQQVFVMYTIFFMFVAIVLALTKILIPISELSTITAGASATLGVAPGGPCAAPSSGVTQAVCGFFFAIARVFALGEGIQAYYRALFLSMIIVQGIFSGLIAGQIGEDSVFAGVKHSMIMTAAGFAVFLLFFKLGFG